MLHENDAAPEFVLPDRASGGQLALADLVGSSPVLVMLVPSARDAGDAQAIVDEAMQCVRMHGGSQGNNHLLAIVGPDVVLFAPPSARVHVLVDANGRTTKQYDAPDDGICSYLIDSQGRIASAKPAAPTLDEVANFAYAATRAA